MSEQTGAGMEEDTTSKRETLAIYLRVVDTINEHQARLAWSETVYLVLEVLVFFAAALQLLRLGDRPAQNVGTIGATAVLITLSIGIWIGAYWVANAMRLQLRLKLRYFQARYLERKLGGLGEDILSGDARFNKDMTVLKSPDGMESIVFPHEGALRTDGFFGGAKPRVLSVLMPGLFFVVFSSLFLWILLEYLIAN